MPHQTSTPNPVTNPAVSATLQKASSRYTNASASLNTSLLRLQQRAKAATASAELNRSHAAAAIEFLCQSRGRGKGGHDPAVIGKQSENSAETLRLTQQALGRDLDAVLMLARDVEAETRLAMDALLAEPAALQAEVGSLRVEAARLRRQADRLRKKSDRQEERLVRSEDAVNNMDRIVRVLRGRVGEIGRVAGSLADAEAVKEEVLVIVGQMREELGDAADAAFGWKSEFF